MANRDDFCSTSDLFADIPHNIRVFSFCDLLGNFAGAMVYPYASLYVLAWVEIRTNRVDFNP